MFKSIVGLLTLAALASNPFVQIEQLEQLRTLGNGRLAGMLSSNDRQVALRAALAIGRTKLRAGLPLLERHVGDSDVAMRAIAVYGIGLIGGAAAAKPVLSALHDSTAVVQIAALDAANRLESAHDLGPNRSREAFAGVVALLRSRDETVRARAATTLAAFSHTDQEKSAVGRLSAAFAKEQSPFVRWHIMWSLYRGFATIAPQSTLVAGLHDRDEDVRIEAVRAFGRRANAADVALLQPLTNDPSWRVQEQTLESIKVVQGGQLTDHLKAIPNGVYTPAPQPDALASLRALPRTPHTGKLQPPSPQSTIMQPKLNPVTVAQFTGPTKGPHPRVRIATTAGNIYLELYPEWAPLTVQNFLNLANEGYYDGNPWFRIVPDFVVQSGDPSETAPGPGYTTVAEENPIEQDSYIVSMGLDYTNPPNAHAKRDSAGSEFYITLSSQLHLNSDFTVFGRVIGGVDVLGRLIESDKILRIERIPDSSS